MRAAGLATLAPPPHADKLSNQRPDSRIFFAIFNSPFSSSTCTRPNKSARGTVQCSTPTPNPAVCLARSPPVIVTALSARHPKFAARKDSTTGTPTPVASTAR